MRSHILSTSALALGLSLGTAHAQGLATCGEGVGVPCQLPDGVTITPPMARALPECPEDGAETAENDIARYMCAAGDDVIFDEEALSDPAAGPVIAELNELMRGALDAEGGAETATQEAETVTEEAAPESAEAEVAIEAEAESAEAEVAAEAEAESAEAEVATEAEAESADAEGAVATEAESAEAEGAVEAEAEVEAESAEAETADEAAPETAEAETEVVPEAESAEAESAETATETAESATTEAEAESTETAEETQTDEEMSPQDRIRAQLEERQRKVLERLNREAQETEPAAAAAAADDTAQDGDATATETAEADADMVVEEQTVTEGDARTSDEEFETAVGGASASATATADSDDGLSAFEKAILVGLGAIAVGQILDNGDQIVSNSGDRVVVRRDGELFVLKDDDALLRRPGSEVRTERFSDGSTREIVTREDGVQIITVRAADGRVLRRARILPDGTRVLLFDDTQRVEPVDLSELPDRPARSITVDSTDEDALRLALRDAMEADLGRRFSLRQIRDIREVRELAPEIEVEAVTFATGSAVIQPDQARELAELGTALRQLIEERPGEVFLVEGHTDAVGGDDYNLALSDRRAESLALALTEYFDVPPENLIVQGYGETALKVPTPEAERENRRALVRRITPLLRADLASNF